MDACHFVFPALQKFTEPIGPFFGAHENEERTLLLLQQMNKEIKFGTLLDFVAEEIYLAGRFRAAFNCDSHRLVHVTVDEVSHGSLDGRRE